MVQIIVKKVKAAEGGVLQAGDVARLLRVDVKAGDGGWVAEGLPGLEDGKLHVQLQEGTVGRGVYLPRGTVPVEVRAVHDMFAGFAGVYEPKGWCGTRALFVSVTSGYSIHSEGVWVVKGKFSELISVSDGAGPAEAAWPDGVEVIQHEEGVEETAGQYYANENKNIVERKMKDRCVLRLAQPKFTKEKFSYQSKKKKGHADGMHTVFPSEKVPEIKKVTPAEDWTQMIRSGEHGRHLNWVYSTIDCITEAGKEGYQTVTERAKRIISKLLVSRGAKQALNSRTAVKSAIRGHDRFGVLIDIVTTRRCVYTGDPHSLAKYLYKYIETTFPIHVKFTFIGITDNSSKRVARDMFYKGVLSVEQGGTGKLPHNPLHRYAIPMEAVDNEHQYAVNPHGDWEREYFKGLGEERRLLREQVRRDRYVASKFEHPEVPEWAVKGTVVEADRGETLESCKRCWRHAAPTGTMRRRLSPVSCSQIITPCTEAVPPSTTPRRVHIEPEEAFVAAGVVNQLSFEPSSLRTFLSRSRERAKERRQSSIAKELTTRCSTVQWNRIAYNKILSKVKQPTRVGSIPAKKEPLPVARPLTSGEDEERK